MKKIFATLLCTVMLATASVASATIIFQDNFNAENGGYGKLNYNGFTNWSVTDGTVDLIGVQANGTGFFDFGQTGHGLYVDLDGSTNNAGILLSRQIMLTSAGAYTFSFDLAGNQRTNNPETVGVAVLMGDYSQIFRVNSDQDFTTYSTVFHALAPGELAIQLRFENAGGDNIGALLDNVMLTQSTAPVPEPGTMMLLGIGLAGLGIYGRRRVKK